MTDEYRRQLDDDIHDIEIKVAEREQQLALLKAELKGMLAGRRYLEGAAKKAGERGGRHLGAISHRWQAVLADLYGRDFPIQDVVDTVMRLEGRQMLPKEARRIFNLYRSRGFVDKIGHDAYRVSEIAAHKYSFASPSPATP